MRHQPLEGLELTAHHRAAIERLVARLEPDTDILALLLAGSLAHGYARTDSDIDVMVLVDDARIVHALPAPAFERTGSTVCDGNHGRRGGSNPVDGRTPRSHRVGELDEHRIVTPAVAVGPASDPEAIGFAALRVEGELEEIHRIRRCGLESQFLVRRRQSRA